MELYMKAKDGEYIPIEFNKFINKDWDNHLIVVRVGNNEYQPTDYDLTEICEMLESSDALGQLKNASLIVVGTDVDIHKIMDLEYMKEVVGNTSFKEVLRR